MAPITIPDAPDDLTPEWLTAALRETGVLQSGRVEDARWERVGEEYGFTGVVTRVHLTYGDAERDAPPSLIAKLPMAGADAPSGYRSAQDRDAVATRRYFDRSAREVEFYRDVGAAFAPRTYFARADEDSRRVALLLEDVSGGRHGDALEGCSIDDAGVVVEALAAFHGRWWGTKARPLERIGLGPGERRARFEARLDAFLGGYGRRLPPELRGMLPRLGRHVGAAAQVLADRPRTLIHGDLHLDNVIFDVPDGRPVVVLDWQTASVGAPAWDLMLFLVGSLSVEDRRSAEGDLLREYVRLLEDNGGRGYSVDALRVDCAAALVVLLAGTVGWLVTVRPDELTGRERALHDSALTDGRLAAALVDFDALAWPP